MSQRTVTIQLVVESTMSDDDVRAELARLPKVWNACRTLYFPSGVRMETATVNA